MILKKIRLINFRGYKDTEIKFSPNLNVIIGRNDVGKSTILEALAIFFENDAVAIDLGDLNVSHGEDAFIAMEVSFSIDKNKKYLIDTDRETSLGEEFLTNGNNTLTIRKEWDCSKNKLTAVSLKIYIIAQYLKEFKENPLVTVKIKDLKKIAEEHGVLNDITDLRICSSIRKAIYDSLEDKSLSETKIQIDKEDAKKLYDNIKKEFPNFEIFQSDRANKDTDKQVQDPLKIIVRRSIDEIKEQLDNIQKEVEKKAEEIGNKTIEKLKEMDPEIASTMKPNMKVKAWDSLFSFSFLGDEDIPLNKRGSGVRRLIMLNFFRADAEDKASSKNGIIYAIEEPETSQHPNFQKMLVNALLEIAKTENKQVIITTHSPEIAKICDSEKLILIKKGEQDNPYIEDDEKIKMGGICETLGMMPVLRSLVVYVEGPNDVNFLMNINQKIPELKDIIDLKKEKISLIPLNGGNLIQWIDKNYLGNANVKEFLICDSDKGGHDAERHNEEIEKLRKKGDGSDGILTKKREMENYISKGIYEQHFKRIDFSDIHDWDTADLPQFILGKLHDPKINEKIIKQKINGSLAQNITKDSLIELNAFDEVKGWFEKIRDMYQSK